MTTSDWIAVVGLLFSAATLAVLLWTTFLRRPKPPLICRVERLGDGLFILFVHPVAGHEAELVDVVGNGVELAKPITQAGYDPGPLQPSVFGPVMPMGVPLRLGQEKALYFHFFASQPSTARSRFRFQKSSSISVRARLVSPISVRIDARIPISIA